ncbi:GNAT family N-acetyltransferase [Gibbsiella quercinecans]|uniref:Histone acetyltransferase n=1 Tax=Gibbsiella quercinecans TaxID=929813 RepID=A0A250AXA3_9GAMM|nr:GNAT family N-acetyltransferase [Gibbsiella quercinecans]ATA18547.1 histone acetyltransferase [Gibbsiella quercinecans]RLM04333.1 histone acetyltransferase [Gibbsiella quercinecans]RLM07239.1 histone acetyltransferase [Gibbsiella quercinecans]
MDMQIVPMNESHLDAAFALTQRLQWPHRREDWQQALRLGEGLAAVEAGRLLGTALCWRWGSEYATLGLVIVADEAQGQGFGKQLMLAALDKLPGSNVRLHATEAGRGLYEKLGFVATGWVEQHQNRALGAVDPISPAAGQRLRTAAPADIAQLVALDRQAHGQHRPELFACLMHSAERILLLEETTGIEGFACLRRFGHGYVIGPVIARDLAVARVLVSQLLSGLNGQFVRIDTDADNGLGDWLSGLGMATVDAPTIMVKGMPWQPEAGGMRAFGLMTQAMA